ncbi:MAG: ComEC/Rec2 family competence protein [Bdellovibrionales bacterium]
MSLLTFVTPLSFYQLLTPWIHFFNESCLNFNPIDSNYDNVWNALVCGKGLADNDFSHQLKATGLIHIFVVSGSHFLILQQIFERLRIPSPVGITFLVFFNFLSGFTAPGTRACLGSSLNPILKLNGHQKVLFISVMTLLINPDWIRSYSFWLSWLASLILEISPKDRFRIIQNFLYYLTWSFLGMTLSLWSIPLNVLIAPLIGWVLFPLSLLSFFPGFDLLFTFLLKSLEHLFELLNLSQKKVPFGLELWGLSLLTLLSHFFIMALDLRKKGRTIT